MLRRGLLIAAGLLVAYLVVGPKPWAAATGPGYFAVAERPMVDVITIGLWWMALPNLVLCGVLWWTAPFWAAPVREPVWAVRRPGRAGAGFVLLLLVAAFLGGALRWNLAQGSLWWDEAWTVKRAVVGHREPIPEQPDALSFRQVRWHWTVWHYKKPTNHVAYSISARLSNGVWRAWNGREPWAFDEFALRLPAFAAALAAIVAVGLLVRSWSSPAAGLSAAFLLALHPWHVEHGAELRAYGYVALLAVLSCLALARVLRTAAFRWIGVFAALQFALLWSHPFTIYLVASLTLFGAIGLLSGEEALGMRARRATRLVAGVTLAGMAWLQVMAPNLAQVRLWTDVNEPSKGRVVQSRAVDSLTVLAFAGLPRKYGSDEPDGLEFPSADSLAKEHAWVAPVVYGVLPALALIGLVACSTRRAPRRYVAWGLAAAVPLAIAVAWAGQLFFHERFVFYALIAVVLFVPIGLDALLRGLTRPWPRAQRVAVPVGLALGLVGFASLVAPRLDVLRNRPYAPLREVAAYVRQAAGNEPLSALRVGYGSGGAMPALYDPWIDQVQDDVGVAAAMERARQGSQDLYLFYGYPTANRPRRPSGFRYLDDPRLFELVAHFKGADPHFSYWVLRYTGNLPEEGAPS